MRITGGKACGIPLKAPSGSHVRPATDFMREAVFSSLGAAVAGARALDLFAGTGAYGLEAVSRGAEKAVFVEKNKRALGFLRENVAAAAKAMAMDEVTREARLPIEPRDAMKWKGPWRSFRLIFADPPYAFWLQTPKAIIVRGLDYLAEDDPRARLVCEAPGGFELIAPRGLRIVKKIARGPRQPAVTIFARDEDAESGAR